MQIMAIFYSIIYIQYGAYTHHIIIGHSCVEYKEEVFVMIVYDRLWITLKKKNISQYALKIAKFNSTIHLYSGILFCTSGV